MFNIFYLCNLGVPERSIPGALVQVHDQSHVGQSDLKFQSTDDSGENKFSTRENHSTLSILFSPPSVLRSAFGPLKSALDIALSNQRANQENHRRNVDVDVGACVKSNEIQDCDLISKSNLGSIKGYFEREIGSYTCNLAVDLFWPLCMYELRGKCNNDECPWQHVKDFSDGNMYQHDDSGSAGMVCLKTCGIFYLFFTYMLKLMFLQVVRLDQQFIKKTVMMPQNFPRVMII